MHLEQDLQHERGGAVGVEMALVWIAVLTLVLAVIQVALVFYAGQLALTAAEDGVRSGRAYEVASAESALRDAEAFLARASGTTLQKAHVTAGVDEAAGTLTVTVAGEVLSLLPGIHLHVSRSAVGGLERVNP